MAAPTQYFQIARRRIRPRRFRSLFLFVTSRCNSRCRTCFYFEKLNSGGDLSFEEIRRLSQTAPQFEQLWISGGEPFLREELADILGLFVRRNGVRNINLPTNGLLPARTFRVLDRVLAECPDVSIDLNFSLDGLASTHDAIRGVPNNFERTLETIAEAERRYGGVRRLRRNVATVITRENYTEIVSLGLRLVEEARLDGHYFEAMRGAAPDPALKRLTAAQLNALHRALMPLHRRYAARLFGRLPAPARAFATMYYLGNIRLHFDLHERCFERPVRWPMACTAGETSLVVDHDGWFRACELRQPLGRVQDYAGDLGAVLASGAVERERGAIREANCWCTHSCFIQDSSKFSPRVQLFSIPWAWLRQRLHRLPALPLEEVEKFKALELA